MNRTNQVKWITSSHSFETIKCVVGLSLGRADLLNRVESRLATLKFELQDFTFRHHCYARCKLTRGGGNKQPKEVQHIVAHC